ncbi:MAG: DUF4129 domain-containing protein [Gammaproteobacteria bacterium]|nr:DUF4129 domain-containing protein [Gammaproteobacteria bacterium]
MARALLALLLVATLCIAQVRATPAESPGREKAHEPLSAHEGLRAHRPQPSPRSQNPRELLALIDQCAGRLDSALDVGYARIAARCPELTPALSESPWAAWLPADWKQPYNRLSSAGLEELRTLIARESARDATQRPLPRTMRVAAVLAAVSRSDDARASRWWQRFRDWLRRIFAPPTRPGGDWLKRFLADLQLSGQATELIAWGAFALVVTLALTIVISELKVAGLLARRASRTHQGVLGASARAVPSVESIEHAAPEEQPALLLALIASRLTEQQRLPPARALTARELGRQAALPEESGRGQLGELVSVCERVRFSGETVGSALLTSAMRSGRRLLATLDVTP